MVLTAAHPASTSADCSHGSPCLVWVERCLPADSLWPGHTPPHAAHERQDLGTRAGIEVAGRLVTEDDRRAAGKCPGDGDPLLLTARQFARAMAESMGETNGRDDLVEPMLVGLAAGECRRQGDVLQRVQRRNQVEGLEDEPDLVSSEQRQTATIETGEIGVADEDAATGQRVEPGEKMHQRALAGAALGP